MFSAPKVRKNNGTGNAKKTVFDESISGSDEQAFSHDETTGYDKQTRAFSKTICCIIQIFVRFSFVLLPIVRIFAGMNQGEVMMDSLRIGYKTHKGTRIVAEGITAAIRQGELTCLLGENGVGKSTLLRTLAGFMPPLGGTIRMGGQSLDELTPRQLARTVGVVLTERLDVQQMQVSSTLTDTSAASTSTSITCLASSPFRCSPVRDSASP